MVEVRPEARNAPVDSATWQAGFVTTASPRCARRHGSTRWCRRTSRCATRVAAPRRACAPSTTRSRRRSTSRPSRGFYHCLAGETRVLTWDGVRPISELAGGTHRILGARGDWIEAPFKSYGVQRLHRIVLTRNRQSKELFATDGHRWFVRTDSSSRPEREVVTADLAAGARLVPKYPGPGSSGPRRPRSASRTASPTATGPGTGRAARR